MDIKLLMIFEEVFKTRSASQAALNLGIGQSAVSMGLARLRKHFGDPLFVRTPAGFQPTVHAEEVHALVAPALSLLQLATTHLVQFEPKTSTRTFNLCMSDLGLVSILPRFLKILEFDAPGVSVTTFPMTELTAEALASGSIDIAVGLFPHLDAGFFQQRLFEEHFICASRQLHPRIAEDLTLQIFQSERHLVVEGSSTARWVLDTYLDQLHIHREIGLRVPNFLSVPALLKTTNFIATVPASLSVVLEEIGGIKTYPTPFDIPKYQIKQYWHSRYAKSSASQWLRAQLARVCFQ